VRSQNNSQGVFYPPSRPEARAALSKAKARDEVRASGLQMHFQNTFWFVTPSQSPPPTFSSSNGTRDFPALDLARSRRTYGDVRADPAQSISPLARVESVPMPVQQCAVKPELSKTSDGTNRTISPTDSPVPTRNDRQKIELNVEILEGHLSCMKSTHSMNTATWGR
jgi:hypothetical protein